MEQPLQNQNSPGSLQLQKDCELGSHPNRVRFFFDVFPVSLASNSALLACPNGCMTPPVVGDFTIAPILKEQNGPDFASGVTG